MAINATLRNALNADTVHAVVRCDEKTHRALKTFMHCRDAIAIRFPTGVGLFRRGRGWYRLEAQQADRAVHAIATALKIIRRFVKELELGVEEEIKRLMPAVRQGLRVATFS